MMKWVVVLLGMVTLGAASEGGHAGSSIQARTGGGLASLLGTIGLIKVKAVIIIIGALFIASLYAKLVGGCEGGYCPLGGLGQQPATPYASDYDYHSYSTRALNQNGKSFSFDPTEIGFNVFGITGDECRKKVVCILDNESVRNPLLNIAMTFVGGGLSKYRDGEASDKEKNCSGLYPGCTKDVLLRDKDNEWGP